MIARLSPPGGGLLGKPPSRVYVQISTTTRYGASSQEINGALIYSGAGPGIPVGEESANFGPYGQPYGQNNGPVSNHTIYCTKITGVYAYTPTFYEIYNNIDCGPGTPTPPSQPYDAPTTTVRRAAEIVDSQYKFVATLPPGGWKAAWGAITIPYRICTVTQTSQYSPLTESGSETATQAYTAMTATITPADGAVTAESEVYTLAAGDYGTYCSVVGSDQASDLNQHGTAPDIGFAFDVLASTNAKFGVQPYWRAAEDSAGPVPCYQCETASTAPLPPAQTTPYPAYSGSQTWTLDTTVNVFTKLPTQDFNSTLSDNVASEYRSKFGEVLDPSFVAAHAVQAGATSVQWPNGLVMTLSQPQPTSALTDPVDQLLANSPWDPATTPGGDTAPSLGPIAGRFLPADELTYFAAQGRYRVVLYVGFSPSVPSFIGRPPPIVTSDSLDLAWNRVSVDLDTGVVTTSAQSATLTLTADVGPVDEFGEFSYTLSDAFTAMYQEPVPSGNTLILLDSLTVTGVAPSLRPGFAGRVGL